MPYYDYQCGNCGHVFTLRLSISAYTAGVKAECPVCASPDAARRFGAVNVLGDSGAAGSGGSPCCGGAGFS